MSGVRLVLHQHTIAGVDSQPVDRRRGAAQRDVAIGERAIGRRGRGLDLVVGAAGRHRDELETGLAEDRCGGIDERPATRLRALAGEYSEARGQFGRGVGVGGTSPRSSGHHVDAVFRRGRLVLQQHAVADVERDTFDRQRAACHDVDVLDRRHSHGLLHGSARTSQRVGRRVPGSRDEVDVAGSAGRHAAPKGQRRCVECDGAVGG